MSGETGWTSQFREDAKVTSAKWKWTCISTLKFLWVYFSSLVSKLEDATHEGKFGFWLCILPKSCYAARAGDHLVKFVWYVNVEVGVCESRCWSYLMEAIKGCSQRERDSLLCELQNRTIYSEAYANDVSVLAVGRTVCRTIQLPADLIDSWCLRQAISANPNKTTMALFTKRRKLNGSFPFKDVENNLLALTKN